MIFSWFFNLAAFLFFLGSGMTAAVSGNPSVLSLDPAVPAPIGITERSAVLSADDRFFFWSQRGDEVQPIASITKLMTALVFLESNPGWETVYQITDDDHITGGRLNLFRGDRVTAKDLFYTSLVASDNGATIALVHATGLSEEEFVDRMNAKASSLGLFRTHFVDPVGLSDQDVSTAREVAVLAQAALRRPEIKAATEEKSYAFRTLDDKEVEVLSTDDLLLAPNSSSLEILGGKTGYTEQAGYCFVGRFRGPDGREAISAVLNAASPSRRFLDSRALADWALKSYKAKK